MSNGPWTDEENDLIVAEYFAMLADDIPERRYSKAEHFRALRPLPTALQAADDNTGCLYRAQAGSDP
jgi:hypothetical protein